jgi:penicillin-insensitive murein endopeptidase
LSLKLAIARDQSIAYASLCTLLVLMTIASPAFAASTCFGTVSNGRLEGGVSLPRKGSNFEPYADLAVTLGRTYVHASVEAVVVDAYARVEKSRPDLRFVYGETGWKNGGRFKPHRTHQNGTSVDFMVPVRNGKGESIPLPRSIGDRYGYDLEFNRVGRLGQLQIDFEAVAEHLYQLSRAARARRFDLALVIFDPQYLPNLYATRRGDYLRQNIRFMKGKPWVRHDDHYHVDFAVKCRA